ncbi:MAG: DUF4861 domain-containing protein [Prevotella sp.]|nr:DUF4861 domain-containing protein [Prevotella sp.]
MKRTAWIIVCMLAVITAMAADKTVKVSVANTYCKERKAVPVVVKLDGTTQSALVTLDGKEIPCQLDDLNDDGLYDELSFVTDMKKKEKQTFDVVLSDEGAPREYPAVCYGSIAIRDRAAKNQKHMPINAVTFPKTSNPYQYIFPHGAVMENDMVGFRAYCDHRQSIDYYGHQQLKADIAETAFYPTAEQKAAGSGDDVLWTGSTFGCGTMHAWDAKKGWTIMYDNVRNTTMEVVAAGAVRTVLRITNRAWQPLESFKPVDVVTTYLLYKGHRDVQVDVKFSHAVEGLPLAIGTVDIADPNGAEEHSDCKGLRACWGKAWAGNNPQVYEQHTVGLAVNIPEQYYKGETRFSDMEKEKIGTYDEKARKLVMPNQALVDIVGTNSDHINYWFAATCDFESFGFKSSKEWFDYLENWKKELNSPAAIEIK